MKLLDQSAQTNWKFIAIVAFVAVFLAGGILMLIPQFQEQSPPLPQQNTSQIDTSGSPPNSIEGWQIYRNDEFGFEVKYPADYFIVHPPIEEFNINGLALVVDLKSELTPILRILVQQLSEAQYNAHVEYIRTLQDSKEITLGGTSAFQYTTCGSAACRWAITFQRDTHQYEILPLMTGDFDGTETPSETTSQILSTFRFVEEKRFVSATNAEDFCLKEDETFELETSMRLNNTEKGLFVLCSDPSWSFWSTVGQGVLTLYILAEKQSGYEVMWQKSTSEDLNLRSVRTPQVVDLDKDSIDELIISGSNWGGTCTRGVDTVYVYSPRYDELFSVSQKEWFDEACENLIKDPPKFSQNLEMGNFKLIRDYLASKFPK